MKICILSDSHDHIPLLNAAVAQAVKDGCEAVLHCGDVVAPSTLKCLLKYKIPVHIIHGNNAGDLYATAKMAHQSNGYMHYYGMDAGIEIEGRKIFIVHYPHYARAMATSGDWDIVCCGHSHKVSLKKVLNVNQKKTWLINPGTIGGVGQEKATYIQADLIKMTFDVYTVEKSIEHHHI